MSVSTIINKTTGKIYEYLYDKGVLTPTTKGFATVSSGVSAGIPDQSFLSADGEQLIYLPEVNLVSADRTIINMVEDDVITFAKDGNYRIEVRLNVKLSVHSTKITIPALTLAPSGTETEPKDINYPPPSHNFQIQFYTKGTIDPVTAVYTVGVPIGEGAFISVNSNGNHQLHLTETLSNITVGTEISLIGVAHIVNMEFAKQPQTFTMSAIPAIKVNIYEL